jgi:hypothetical protein
VKTHARKGQPERAQFGPLHRLVFTLRDPGCGIKACRCDVTSGQFEPKGIDALCCSAACNTP